MTEAVRIAEGRIHNDGSNQDESTLLYKGGSGLSDIEDISITNSADKSKDQAPANRPSDIGKTVLEREGTMHAIPEDSHEESRYSARDESRESTALNRSILPGLGLGDAGSPRSSQVNSVVGFFE